METMKIENSIFEEMYNKYKAEQLVIAAADVENTSDAAIQCYERIDSKWTKVYDVMEGKIGRNGFTEDKAEGDGKTPMGAYSFSRFFGTSDNIGFKFDYTKVDGKQLWVDDPKSDYYNTWQEEEADGRWDSCENLLHPAYKFAAVIDYNTAERIKGKGSAIFFHKINLGPTAGCIALHEEDLVKVLKWLDPSKKPFIINGTYSYINKGCF